MQFEFDTRMLDEIRFADFHFYSVVLSKPLPIPHPIVELYNRTETHNYMQIIFVHIQN